MRILILNWRDIKNPKSGGAEVLTHELAKRLVEIGHGVTQISSVYPNCKLSEKIDGVSYLRMGKADLRHGFSSVHFKAFIYYVKYLRSEYDLVIDEIHGLPFFTPLYVKKKKIALICEVSDELWYETFGTFVGLFGRMAEVFYVKYIYKKIKFVTISNSTKNQLIDEGINKHNISVIPMGVSLPKILKIVKKETTPTLIFVGRLTKAKGVKDAIKSFNIVNNAIPESRLWVVGRGEPSYQKYLKDLVKDLGLNGKINFLGFVPEEIKFKLMSSANILIVPSKKEGWGLIVTEAGYVGTPSVGYNVPGLRDVIKNKKNGILVNNDPESMAEAVINLLKNKSSYLRLSKNAAIIAKKSSWDNTVKTFSNIVNKI